MIDRAVKIEIDGETSTFVGIFLWISNKEREIEIEIDGEAYMFVGSSEQKLELRISIIQSDDIRLKSRG